ncbi:MAG: DUF359 domain-containing protein [Candidatus Paceibacterales bacterium]
MKTYLLPKELRKELRKIWGIPIFGRKKEVARKFKDFVQKKKFKKIITVGDHCSLHLPSDIKIFDGKIKRKKVKKILPFSLSCSNPAGTIQSEVWPIIKKAIRDKKNVFIEGEEDLLVIPSVLLSERRTLVIYGFLEKGVCLIEVKPEMKKAFKELLKKFKTK